MARKKRNFRVVFVENPNATKDVNKVLASLIYSYISSKDGNQNENADERSGIVR